MTGIPDNMNGSLSSPVTQSNVTVQVYTPPDFGV